MAAISIDGIGPQPTTLAASSAAPVGVVSSWGTSTPYVGAPRSSSTTAGAGIGSTPWAARVIPMPLATGDA